MGKKGFTLIEVMIVLALLGALIGYGAPRLFKKQTNIKTAVRHFIVLSREIRNKARLNNSTYRLVVQMDDKEQKYWVERANGPQAIDIEAQEKEREEGKNKDKKEDAPPPLFQIDKSLTKKEQTLPEGLRFGQVETVNSKSAMTSGTAYIHFFPEGFVEAAAIQITDGNKLTWTLVFNPLTGQADIIEKAQSLKDIQR
ncbi:Tfp pilus assembly protein FimT/FimU [Bdellovibrio sp. NC01]|uniref:pilus assembly FimT family protein n=1 Tax=Bdellovibrio sp. NC01 TaxID=2220073 RepID=UPI001159143A|nr:type II secretion system protein [Bdellovibrio sp. NC01]QDK37429.1 type II secretion system protein [Bdellovibrio sp. NC01]